MQISLTDIWARIEQERKAISQSGNDFAAAIGLSERQYRRIRRQGADISVELLLKICAATDRDPDYFLLDTNPLSSARIEPGVVRRLSRLPDWCLQILLHVIREAEKR